MKSRRQAETRQRTIIKQQLRAHGSYAATLQDFETYKQFSNKVKRVEYAPR